MVYSSTLCCLLVFFCIFTIPIEARRFTVSTVSRPIELTLPSLSIHILQSEYIATKVCYESVCKYFDPCLKGWQPVLSNLFVEETQPLECEYYLEEDDKYIWLKLSDLFVLNSNSDFAQLLCSGSPQYLPNANFSEKSKDIQPRYVFSFRSVDYIWHFDNQTKRGHIFVDSKDIEFIKELPFDTRIAEINSNKFFLQIRRQSAAPFCFLAQMVPYVLDERQIYAFMSYSTWPSNEMINLVFSWYTNNTRFQELELPSCRVKTWTSTQVAETHHQNTRFLCS
jgi:hypothetical protein